MRTLNIILGILMTGVIFAGCTRHNTVIEPPLPAVASKSGDGKAVLKVTPRHHLKNIQAAKVYIKYNALTQPASGTYDDSLSVVVQPDGRPIAEFDSLTAGNYYLYSVGYDAAIEMDVKGGAVFTVIDSLPKTYDIYLDVTEPGDHKN